MQITMTLAERILQAEKLPQYGSLGQMALIGQIRSKLVGFVEATMDTYCIVPHNGTFITRKPDTRLNVTLTDEQVTAWAELIMERSRNGEIGADEAVFCNSIVGEAERIANEAETGEQ